MKHIWIFVLSALIIGFTSCNQGATGKKSDSNQQTMTAADSIEMYSSRIATDSTDYKSFLNRGRLYLNSGQLDPAFRDVGTAIEIEKNDANSYILLADLYFLIGQADNSTSSLKKALEIEPENIEIALKLARTYLMLRDYQTSSQFIDYALKLDMDNPEAYYLRGIEYLESGDTLKAIVNLKIAGNLDSTFYVAFMHTGTVESMMSNPDAIKSFQAAVKSKPEDERALYMLAMAYQENELFDEAIETYTELNNIHPGNSHVNFNMGYIYLVEKQMPDEAVDMFQKAILISPSYYEAVYNLGRAYEEKEMYEEARVQYRQALTIKTNYSLAIEGLNRIDEIQYPD